MKKLASIVVCILFALRASHSLYAQTQPTTQRVKISLPGGVVLRVTGLSHTQLDLDQAAFDKLPLISVKATDKGGVEATYSGVPLVEVLKLAGIPVTQLRGALIDATVHVHAADGYSAAFALTDFDDGISGREVLLAVQRNDQRLSAADGPIHLIVPSDKRPARCVRMVRIIEVR